MKSEKKVLIEPHLIKEVKSKYVTPVIKVEIVKNEESICKGSAVIHFGSQEDVYYPEVEQWDGNSGWSNTKDLDIY